MFCPNCGNKVQSSDNYCPNCGTSLKNISIQIIENNASDQETRTFKPLTNLSGIDSTSELKDIIKAVDEKISKNISDYEKQSSILKGSEEPSKENHKEVKDLSKTNELNFKKENLDSLNDVKKIKKEIKKEEPSVKANTKDKKSLKEKFKDFINEDDDQFSIFSSFNDEKQTEKLENLELTQPETKNFENTMDVPIVSVVEEETIKKSKPANDKPSAKEFEKKASSYDYKSFTELVNAELEKSKSENQTSDKISTPKQVLDKSKVSKATKPSKDNLKTEKTSKLEIKKDTVKHNNIEEKVSANSAKVEEKENISDKLKNKFSNLSKKLKSETKKESVVEPKQPRKDEHHSLENISNTIKTNAIFQKLSGVHTLATKLNEKQLLIFAILLSIIPVVVSVIKWQNFSLVIVFCLLVKIIVKLAQFYVPLNLAVEKAWIDSSDKEVKHFALINYFMSEIIMLVMFLLSPWYGMFYFKTLSAFTAFPVATIVLVLFATTLSVSQFHDRLKETNKIDFIGWYMILFIIFEFIGKIIFLFTDIIV